MSDEPMLVQRSAPEVTVAMPLALTTQMIRALRENPLTRVDDTDEWHTRLGWLVCAYSVLIKTVSPGAPDVE